MIQYNKYYTNTNNNNNKNKNKISFNTKKRSGNKKKKKWKSKSKSKSNKKKRRHKKWNYNIDSISISKKMNGKNNRKDMDISIKIKSNTNSNVPIILWIGLDNGFNVKPWITKQKNKIISIQFHVKGIDIPDNDPCMMINLFVKRSKEDPLYTRTDVACIPFTELENKKRSIDYFKGIKCSIELQSFKISNDYDYILTNKFDVKTENIVNEISNGIYYHLDGNFSFKRLDKVAIFYSQDLLYKMNILSALMPLKFISNEEFWTHLLDKFLEHEEFLKDVKFSNFVRLHFKNPDPYDAKTTWLDLLTYVVTYGFNYRTDALNGIQKDFYSSPFFNKMGDCDDVTIFIMQMHNVFIRMEFKDDHRLIDLQYFARKYIPFFNFNLTGSNKTGKTGKEDSHKLKKEEYTGHVYGLFLTKLYFFNQLRGKHKNYKRIKELLRNDPDLKACKKYKLQNLLGEGTSIISSHIKSLKYEKFDPELVPYIQRLNSDLRTEVTYGKIKDQIQLRFKSDPTTGFYKKSAMLFTPYFYLKNRNGEFNSYGFVCSTKNENENENENNKSGKKPYYGADFMDIMNSNSNVLFYCQPSISKEFLSVSDKNWRYKIPFPTLMINNKKTGTGTGTVEFESMFQKGSDKFYDYDYDDSFFSKDLKQFIIKQENIKEVLSYCSFSDEEIFNPSMRKKILDHLRKEKNVRIVYLRQKVIPETSLHFFKFVKEIDTSININQL